MIQALFERGVYQKDIAAELEVHPKTGKPCVVLAPFAVDQAAIL